LTASGVRFHHGDVVDRLVARGLMLRPAAPTSTMAGAEDQDTVAGASIVEQSNIGAAKAYFKEHPQRPDETDPEYIDRLYELSKPRWRKKTLQNAFYASRRQSHN